MLRPTLLQTPLKAGSAEIALPSRDFERDSRTASDCEDRRAVGGRPGRAHKGRVAHEHQRASGSVNGLSVNGEDRVPAHYGEQLLVAVRAVDLVVALVVRLHHLITRVPSDPVDPEGSNVEVTADQMEIPIGGVRILRVDVRRSNDVLEENGTERRLARVGHAHNLAGRDAKVKTGIPRPAATAATTAG